MKRSVLADVGLAALMVFVSASVLAGLHDRNDSLPTGAWVLAFAHAAPVAARRRVPRAAFATSVVAGALYIALGWPMVGLGIAALVMTYSLAAEVPRRASLAGFGAGVAAFSVAVAVGGVRMDRSTIVGDILVLAAAWALGDSTRRRREAAEAQQAERARQAVADERMRIARELHDIVAHSMSVVTVQAGAGRAVVDDDPAAAKASLAAIEAASRQALDEMRRMLHVLRDAPDGGPALAPMPGLDDLDGLVAHAVAGGTPVDMRIDGERPPLPAGVELAAYRVVQEALTNVRRHAPGAPARVRISYDDVALHIEVENRVIGGTGGDGGGHGIAGMRERVALYGGTVEAGAGDDGAFRVRARIPYQAAHR